MTWPTVRSIAGLSTTRMTSRSTARGSRPADEWSMPLRGFGDRLEPMRSAMVLDAPAGENAVREAVGDAGAQQLLGDPLDDRVAGHVARRGLDQRPAHRMPDGVLGERALQHAVDRPLRVRGGDHGIDDGQRGAAGEVSGGRPCACAPDAQRPRRALDRPERHADRIRRQALRPCATPKGIVARTCRHVSAFLASAAAFLDLHPQRLPA